MAYRGKERRISLIRRAKDLGNVSQACREFGVSRETYYEWKSHYRVGDMLALSIIDRNVPNAKNRVGSDLEGKVIAMSLDHPTYGKQRISEELKKVGMSISPSGVRSVQVRYDLETRKKRLEAVVTKSRQEGLELKNEQKNALERLNRTPEFDIESDIMCPGYVGAQDTLELGKIKKIGPVFQHTFIDVYSKVAIVKLSPKKNDLTAKRFLTNEVLPFYDNHRIGLRKIETDQGNEFYQWPYNEYQKFLSRKGITHDASTANNQCEQFHHMIMNEFYLKAIREGKFRSVAEFVSGVNQWVTEYNQNRPHTGRYCYGKTPMQTFKDSTHIAEKFSQNT